MSTLPTIKSAGGLMAVALALLMLVLLVTAYAVADLRNSEKQGRSNDELRLELARLQGVLVDAETGQRGYLATGDRTFLEPYDRALALWRGSLDAARALTAESPHQTAELDALEALIETKFGDLKGGIADRERGFTGAALTPHLAAGKRTMDTIRASIAGMQREEDVLSHERTRQSVRSEQSLFVLLFAAGAGLLLVGASAWNGRARQGRADHARVTELTRAFAETERYRLLVESTNDATFILDPKGRVSTWNAAAARIKGYSADEIIGRHFSTFYPFEDVASHKPDQELVIAARDGVLIDEGWRLRKDGSPFWANVTITAMRDSSGELVGFAKVTRDLTERIQNEERLRHLAADNAALEVKAVTERDERVRREFLAKAGEAFAASLDYRTTLSTVAGLVVPTLADWCSINLIEPGAAASVQVAVAHTDPSKVQLARDFGERYPPEAQATRGAPQVIRTGKSELYAELPAPLLEQSARDDEHLRFIRELRLESAMVVPLAGRDRVLGAMTFIYADSQRRYTETDLAFAEDFARRAAMAIENAQAHAAVGAALEFQERFVAILGHDLRNPLGAIDMARALLAQRAMAANDATTSRILGRIESSSRRMSRMVEQILDVARTRLGDGLEVNPSSMDLGTMLTAVTNELRTAHPARTIHLHCESIVGAWDRDRLEQVFSNLIGNALHHGDPNEPVNVFADLAGDVVRVRVHNQGPPIPEGLRSQIFSPFRRGSKDSRTAKTAGLGLGLFISRELVVKHRGAVEVKSSAAEGTTFQVTLPRVTRVTPVT